MALHAASPEQRRANNPNGCFNWFQPGDTQRERGEAFDPTDGRPWRWITARPEPSTLPPSARSHGLRRSATYPDVFAGRAIIAPAVWRRNERPGSIRKHVSESRRPPACGDLVRRVTASRALAACFRRHGGMDMTVVPPNAAEIVKQWTDVRRAFSHADAPETVDGYPRQVWRNAGATI